MHSLRGSSPVPCHDQRARATDVSLTLVPSENIHQPLWEIEAKESMSQNPEGSGALSVENRLSKAPISWLLQNELDLREPPSNKTPFHILKKFFSNMNTALVVVRLMLLNIVAMIFVTISPIVGSIIFLAAVGFGFIWTLFVETGPYHRARAHVDLLTTLKSRCLEFFEYEQDDAANENDENRAEFLQRFEAWFKAANEACPYKQHLQAYTQAGTPRHADYWQHTQSTAKQSLDEKYASMAEASRRAGQHFANYVKEMYAQPQDKAVILRHAAQALSKPSLTERALANLSLEQRQTIWEQVIFPIESRRLVYNRIKQDLSAVFKRQVEHRYTAWHRRHIEVHQSETFNQKCIDLLAIQDLQKASFNSTVLAYDQIKLVMNDTAFLSLLTWDEISVNRLLRSDALYDRMLRLNGRGAKLQRGQVAGRHHPAFDYIFVCLVDPILNTVTLFALVEAFLHFFTALHLTVTLQYYILLGAMVFSLVFAICRWYDAVEYNQLDDKLKRFLALFTRPANDQELTDRCILLPKARRHGWKGNLAFFTLFLVASGGMYILWQLILPQTVLFGSPHMLSVVFASLAATLVLSAWAGRWRSVWRGVRMVVMSLGVCMGTFYAGRLICMAFGQLTEPQFFASMPTLISILLLAVTLAFVAGVYYWRTECNKDALEDVVRHAKDINGFGNHKKPGAFKRLWRKLFSKKAAPAASETDALPDQLQASVAYTCAAELHAQVGSWTPVGAAVDSEWSNPHSLGETAWTPGSEAASP